MTNFNDINSLNSCIVKYSINQVREKMKIKKLEKTCMSIKKRKYLNKWWYSHPLEYDAIAERKQKLFIYWYVIEQSLI